MKSMHNPFAAAVAPRAAASGRAPGKKTGFRAAPNARRTAAGKMRPPCARSPALAKARPAV